MVRKAMYLLVLIIIFTGVIPAAVRGQASEERWLGIIRYTDWRELAQLEVLAFLGEESGQAQAVVRGSSAQLKGIGLPVQILEAVQPGREYLLVYGSAEQFPASLPPASQLVYHAGNLSLIRMASPVEIESLAIWGERGLKIRFLPQDALTLETAAVVSLQTVAISYDSHVAQMIEQVSWQELSSLISKLSGESETIIDGSAYTIRTRYTTSGTPIKKATRFAYEQFVSFGLNTSYHYWSKQNPELRNVIAELPGFVKPEEVILLTAHLDDMPSGLTAPGADDNASGSAGVLLAAKILSQYSFERTLRFALFTGEEQGLLGSEQYAKVMKNQSEKIRAVYNLDMIGWDASGLPVARLHTRSSSAPGYSNDLELVNLFLEVVDVYGVNDGFAPRLDADWLSFSDHASFWNYGYPAILAIEDDVNDFNAYYHTVNDRLSRLNSIFLTRFVQAAVASMAHAGRRLLNPDDFPLHFVLPLIQR